MTILKVESRSKLMIINSYSFIEYNIDFDKTTLALVKTRLREK